MRGLEKSWHASRGLPFLLGFPLGFQLLLLKIKLCVVTSKLLQLNEEVASSKLELVDIAMVLAEKQDERLDLNPGSRRAPVRLQNWILAKRDSLRGKVGEGILQERTTIPAKESWICHIRIIDGSRIEKWGLDLVEFHQGEQSRQQLGLKLEACKKSCQWGKVDMIR